MFSLGYFDCGSELARARVVDGATVAAAVDKGHLNKSQEAVLCGGGGEGGSKRSGRRWVVRVAECINILSMQMRRTSAVRVDLVKWIETARHVPRQFDSHDVQSCRACVRLTLRVVHNENAT